MNRASKVSRRTASRLYFWALLAITGLVVALSLAPVLWLWRQGHSLACWTELACCLPAVKHLCAAGATWLAGVLPFAPLALLAVGVLWAGARALKLNHHLRLMIKQIDVLSSPPHQPSMMLAEHSGLPVWLPQFTGRPPKMSILQNESLPPLAFTIGLRRPRLVLSQSLFTTLPPDELNAVVAHEAAHLRRGDLWRFFIAHCLRRFLFFLPLSCWLGETFLQVSEEAADEDAVKRTGQPLTLARALLRMAEANATFFTGKVQPVYPFFAPASTTAKAATLQRRLAYLLQCHRDQLTNHSGSNIKPPKSYSSLTGIESEDTFSRMRRRAISLGGTVFFGPRHPEPGSVVDYCFRPRISRRRPLYGYFS